MQTKNVDTSDTADTSFGFDAARCLLRCPTMASRPADPAPGRTVVRAVPARVGLAGNPSDGYGGAVLAAALCGLEAEVSATLQDGVTLDGSGATAMWPTVLAWLDHVDQAGHGDEQRIISASLWTIVDHLRRTGVGVEGLTGLRLHWHTAVPRSIGLAGSSALAVGAIEVAATAWGVNLDRRVIAALALRAEREVLGIAAGWQDRIVQSFGRTVLVDTASMDEIGGVEVPAVTTVDLPHGVTLDLLVGWAVRSATSSDDYHAPLRRHAASLVAPMSELAAIARRAARAVGEGDVIAMAEAMDETWLVRQACAPLRADHAALVELVRSTGMHATTPGSGGSVVAACLDESTTKAAINSLRDAGCEYVRCALS